MGKKKSLWQQIQDAFKDAMSNGSKSQSLAKQSGNKNPSVKNNIQGAYENALKKRAFDNSQEEKNKEVYRFNNNGGIIQTKKQTALDKEQRRKDLIALKNSDQKALAKNIRESQKAHPVLSQLIQGAANGPTFGLMDKAVSKAASPAVRKELDRIEKNLPQYKKLKQSELNAINNDPKLAKNKATTQRMSDESLARTVGEIGGSFAPFAATASGAAKVGGAIAKEGTKVGSGLSKLANSTFVKNIAKKTGVDEAELSAKVLKGLQTDLGMNITTGNVQAIISAIDKASNTEGAANDKVGAGLIDYITNQAINMGIGGAVELAPAAKAGAKALGREALDSELGRAINNKSGYIRLGRDGEEKVALNSLDNYKIGDADRAELEDAIREARLHISNGDNDLAISRIKGAADNVSKRASISVDDGLNNIRAEIRKSSLSIPKANKSDLNYRENFKRANFGRLNIAENGTPVDDYWMFLNEKYGELFPAEITDPVEQMNYLSEFMAKPSSQLIADDEAKYVSENLSNEIWNKLRNNELPIDEAYEKAITPRGEWVSDEINAELLPNGEMDDAIRKSYLDEINKSELKEISIIRNEAKLSALDDYIARLEGTDIPYNDLAQIKGARNAIETMVNQMKLPESGEQFVKGADETIGDLLAIAEEYLNKNKAFIRELPLESEGTNGLEIEGLIRTDDGLVIDPSTGEVLEDNRIMPEPSMTEEEALAELARLSSERKRNNLTVNAKAMPLTREAIEDAGFSKWRKPNIEQTQFTRKATSRSGAPMPISKDMQEAKAMLDEANGFNSIDESMPGIEESPMPQPKNKKSPELKRVAGNYEKLQKAANSAEDKAFSKGKTVGQGEYEITEAGDRNIRTTSKDVIEKAKQETSATYGKGATNTDDTATSKSYITALKNATTDDAERIVQRMKDEGRFDYNLMHHASLKARIEKFAEKPQEFETFLNRVKDANASPTGRGIFGYKEVKEAQYDAYAALSFFTDKAKADNKYGDVCEELFTFIKDNASQGGTVLELQRHMAMMRPDSRIKLATDDLAKMLDRNIGFRKEHPELSADRKERLAQIAEIIKKDSGLKEKAKRLSTKDLSAKESGEAYTEFINEGTKLMPMTVIDYIQEWRYLSMLGNAKTHIRNRFGNTFFGGIREVSNSVAAAVEKYVYRNDKSHTFQYAGFSADAFREARTKKPTTKLGKLGLDAWNESKSSLIKTGDKFDLRDSKGRPRKGVTKFVGKLNELNSMSLEHADETAMSKRFREQFYKVAKKNGLDKLEPNSKEYKTLYSQCVRNASEEALVATHRQANDLAKALNNITSNLTDANASASKRAEAAVVNIVVPFVKTPANILSKSIRYTPEGIIEGLIKIKKAGKTGNIEAVNDAIGMIGEGLTGSGVLALGLFAGMNSDAFTTNAGDEADAKFKKRQGVQNYSATIGNHSYTLDWLSPIASTFFMGVALGKEALNNIEMGTAFSLDNLEMVAKEAVEPILETSMLSGINDVFEAASNNYGENSKKGVPSKVGEAIVYNFLSSMIPTLQGQVSRTAYKSDKRLDSDRYYGSLLESKSGIGALTLGAQTDSWGKKRGEKKDALDYVKAGAINLFSPVNIQKVNIGEQDKELLKEYKALVDGGMDKETAAQIFPKPNSNKEFQFGKKESGKTKVEMNNKELSIYNQARENGGGKDAMEALMRTKMFNKYQNGGIDAKEKLRLIANAPDSTKEVFAWMMSQPQYKNASDEEKKQAYEYMFNKSSSGTSIGNRKSGERAVWKAQGNDAADYEFANDLSAKKQAEYEKYKNVISKEQVLDFIKYGNGKKQYQYPDGTLRGYFTKTQMNSYFAEHPELSSEERAALYNMFTTGKPYGTSSGKGGYRRRSGGGSKGSGKVVNYGQANAYKRSKGYKSLASNNGTSKPKPPIKVGTRVTKDMLPEVKR